MTKVMDVLLFNRFKEKYIGKKIDFDNVYGAQCVDLIRGFTKFVGYPEITTRGNAIDFYKKGLGEKYVFTKNTIFNYPKVGSIVLFDISEYGHIAIAGQSNLLYLNVLEQNGVSTNSFTGNRSGDGVGDNAIRMKRYTYVKCLGWFNKK